MGSRDLDPDSSGHHPGPGIDRPGPAGLLASAAAESGIRAEYTPAGRQTWYGHRDSGSGKGRNTYGGPATGRRSIPTGSGFPPTTSGRPAAISSSRDTGICRWLTAADVCTGLLSHAGVHSAQLCLYTHDRHRRLCGDRQPVRASEYKSIHVRQLLCPELHERGNHALVFVHRRIGATCFLRSALLVLRC